MDLGVIPASIERLICSSERQVDVPNKLRDEIDSRIDSICAGEVNAEWAISLQEDLTWNPVHVHRFTNERRRINTTLWDSNEGGQQEEMAVWVTEGLLRGLPAFRSPQVHEFSGVRELTDVLVTDGLLTFLIESKAFSVFGRPKLPTRSKLANDLVKHVLKASKQLAGAAKNVQRGLRITDSNARDIVIARDQDRPVHAIVLVPDLSLFDKRSGMGGLFFRETTKSIGGFFHILDPAELLRVIQAAEMISGISKGSTPLMALDYYLMERAKVSVSQESPDFQMLLRIQ